MATQDFVQLRTATDEAVEKLLATIKLTSCNDKGHCPAHRDRDICSCPVAMFSLKSHEIDWAKRNRFCVCYLSYLLNSSPAWDYDGSQAAHHAFTAATGNTPKHFVREYLRTVVCKRDFGPSGKQAVTIQAMLDVWMAKNKL